ncbi:hypothetical protein ABL78_0115 [Leptomonas seymouri]|uniref:MORN repeat-containing protein n=1 Tax=Leptomonas seymouri TaxID=5684 RepID=A0A0N0P945_LEPSE|nr:hypothetical protein ABL78_0115 [Leptomonas seymouri]|eukprot:KPI90679.1 hypothetical protein ABL78_0115 [Leptomonas seymouri]
MPSLTHANATAASAVSSSQPSSTPPTAPASSHSNGASNATRSQWSKTFANGDSYSGEALHVNDKNQKPIKDGKGRYNWASSGAVYEGMWKDGRPHGHGVMTVPGNDGYEYTGDYVDGQRSGRGRCCFANGRIYDGEWKDDEMNGLGTVHGAPGVDDYKEYTGHFKVGKRSGSQGRCDYLNGDVYEGSWLAGKRQGMGEWQLHRPSSSLAVAPVRYKGPFDNDAPHTSGSTEAEIDYSDGSSYVGAVNAQLRRHGRGVHRLANGDVFEGSFAQDVRDGRGTLQGSDGTICDGAWRHGQLDGVISVTVGSPQLDGEGVDEGTGVAGAAQDRTSDTRNLLPLRRSPHPLKSYEGPCTSGVLTGASATILYADGSTYRGAVRHGLPHGSGTLHDRPFPYNTSGNYGEIKEGLRRRICATCIPPAASLMLVSYNGAFAAGEPDGTGTAEWQVSTEPAATPASPNAVRATPYNFSELLSEGLQWWNSSYAAVDGTYTGQWMRGLPHGQGTWQWTDGSSYKGNVAFYLPSGNGTYSSSSVTYTGEFKDGEPHGKGTWEDKSQGVSYNGEWSSGSPDGEGVCTVLMESSKITSGGTPRSSPTTGASVTSPCTMVYEGSWKSGKPSGEGRAYAGVDLQRVVYDGQYANGRREGEGTLYFGSVRRGSINSESATAAVHAYAQYCGAFRGGQPGGGLGCLTLKNSTTVEGEFDADLHPCRDAPITVRPHNEAWTFTGRFDASTRTGRGTMKFPNGDVYTGEVEDATGEASQGPSSSQQQHQAVLYTLQRHGEGVYAFVEGNQLRCTWRHNVLHGAGIYTAADGTKTERTYADGVLANDTAMPSVGTSGGLSSVGTGGSIGNVFTPENEFPNTLSEEALKLRLPEVQQQQQQQQQRKNGTFNFVRRGQARQACMAGAAPSSSQRQNTTAEGDSSTSKGAKRSPPAQATSSKSSSALKQPQSTVPRRGSSPRTSISAGNNANGGGGGTSSPNGKAGDADARDSNARIPTRATGPTPSVAAGCKYKLRRHPTGNGGSNATSASPVSAGAGGEQGGSARGSSSATKGAPSSSNSVYLQRFQAGICQLNDESARPQSQSSCKSSVSSSAADKAVRSIPLPASAPSWKSGLLRHRLDSALAAGREQQQKPPSARKQPPVSLHGSLKNMMKEACAIRNSREDEIHLLTEEMRQLNERIWQLRFLITSVDSDSGAKASTPTRGPPSPSRRGSKNAAGATGMDEKSPVSKTQRLAALIQERRVVMEKLQYVVNAPE